MATPNFDDLTAALNLCESPKCDGHPEQCSSCYAIASVLAAYRGKAERAARTERAACAKIADNHAKMHAHNGKTLSDRRRRRVAEQIGADIRARSRGRK